MLLSSFANQDRIVIERAARLLDRPPADFIREVAVREAEQVVLDAIEVRLSGEDFAAFNAHLAA